MISITTMPKLSERRSGVLHHIASLGGDYFNGDLGKEAYVFIDFLASAKQSYWQTLPFHPVGCGYSPYSSLSAFAGESIFIDLFSLVEKGYLDKKELPKKPRKNNKYLVCYPEAIRLREQLLKKSFIKAFASGLFQQENFTKFCKEHQHWLDDFILFKYIRSIYPNTTWFNWPSDLRNRDPQTLKNLKKEHKQDLLYEKFKQFIFWKNWESLKKYAISKNIALIGDIPIYVSLDSADVWAHSKCFQLSPVTKEPEFVAGVPPDDHCPSGQMWGTALYNWKNLQKDDYIWWIQRFEHLLKCYDYIRLDHFIGFKRYWQIPVTATSAKEGKWLSVPGEDFFRVIKRKLGGLPFIAEDLGLVTQEVRNLRDQFSIPGIRVMQFGFEGSSYHRPFHFHSSVVAYTSTHDNDTARGWLRSLKRKKPSSDAVLQDSLYDQTLLALSANKRNIHWNMIRYAMASIANTVILASQDIVGLPGKARMNSPGTPCGNWRYRLPSNLLSSDLAEKLGKLTEAFERSPDSSLEED